MVRFTALLMVMVLMASALTGAQPPAAQSAGTQTLVISRAGSRPVPAAPETNFTGDVRVERLYSAVDPSHSSGGIVNFAPGARTAWHSHPGGQILMVTVGTGRVQIWGQPIEEIRVGDVVTIPAGIKHWHGAAPNASMSHLGITEQRDGTAVQWMEKVSDEQYDGALAKSEPPPQAPAQPTRSEQPAPSSNRQQGGARPSGDLQARIAPGLATLTDDVLYGDVWNRSELSPRDRSLVTLTVLIATGQTGPLGNHLARALTNGLKPSEASALLAHLAIYCGWPSAVAALQPYEQVYNTRNVDTSSLAATTRLPAPASEAARGRATGNELAAVAPKFVQLTRDVVVNDLWRRGDLSVRDRSLVTIAALAAMGDDDQLDLYLRGGLDSGLTRVQIGEALTHVGFYAGWPKATKALTAATTTLGK
jgi:4-carboxymuconolactone decarboxylase